MGVLWVSDAAAPLTAAVSAGGLPMKVKDSETRMTARIQNVEEGVYEADFTIEPTEELTPTTEYDRRFATEAEARAWLTQMAEARSVDISEIVWLPG